MVEVCAHDVNTQIDQTETIIISLQTSIHSVFTVFFGTYIPFSTSSLVLGLHQKVPAFECGTIKEEGENRMNRGF